MSRYVDFVFDKVELSYVMSRRFVTILSNKGY